MLVFPVLTYQCADVKSYLNRILNSLILFAACGADFSLIPDRLEFMCTFFVFVLLSVCVKVVCVFSAFLHAVRISDEKSVEWIQTKIPHDEIPSSIFSLFQSESTSEFR